VEGSTGYLVVGIVSLLLGYYLGNKKLRRRIKSVIDSFRRDDDLEDEDDDE
jgi:hypothetical protein